VKLCLYFAVSFHGVHKKNFNFTSLHDEVYNYSSPDATIRAEGVTYIARKPSNYPHPVP
jgi:hypothetical protein